MDLAAAAGANFRLALDRLIAASEVVVDRPKGTAHPRYPELIYLVAYGYRAQTQAMHGGGLDVWVGSLVVERPRAGQAAKDK